MRRLLLASILTVALLAGVCPGLRAQLPPDARWRTLDTEHFRVTFAVGLEPLARRAADRAERAYALLADRLVRAPRGRIDLVVSDNVDFANGYATPFPTNRVVIYAHPPVSEPTLAFYDDWVELVVAHELVHIFQLDYARGIWGPLRRILGRNPLFFPQIFSPGWVVEGLATFLESELTRAGRVRGTQHDMVLRAAILEDEFFSIDRATGDPVSWPAGRTPYVYGSLFMAHLAARYGPERVAEFVEATGRQLIPYRPNAAARRAFGTSFTRAWRAWEDSLRLHYRAVADSVRAQGLTEPEILTARQRYNLHPRFSPSGEAVAFVSATGTDEPSTLLLLPDGSQRELAARTTLGPVSWLPGGEGVLHAQHELVDPYRVYSDLYRVDRSGDQDRLTRGARLWEPDVHPDGRRVVAVGNAAGTNVLVLRDLHTGAERRLTAPSLDVHWSAPRWSPDGTRIAVGRWTRGGFYDVVLLDSAGAVVRELTADRAVDSDPAWSPDGRYVLFTSDRTGIPNLFAYDLEAEALLQVSNVLTGAFHPDVAPDRSWIAFVYYQADGYSIARMPFAPERWRPAPPVRPEVQVEPLDSTRYTAVAGGPARAYSPWRSLAPASWLPLLDAGTDLGTGFGLALYGEDLVGRHEWSADALLYPDGTRGEGTLAYRYRGLGNPVLDLRASQDWWVRYPAGTELRNPPVTLETGLLRRDREYAAALTWLLPRWRRRASIGIGGDVLDRHQEWADEARAPDARLFQFPLDLGASLHGGYSSARGYGISLGPQEGITATTRLEARRFAEPFPGDSLRRGYSRLTGRTRAYTPIRGPGFARHVLALRLDGGMEHGSVSPGLEVGGSSGGSTPFLFQPAFLGGGVAFPIRGYAEGVQSGDRAFVASAEYRFPLTLVERGLGVWPLFLERLWADAFVDVGSAWCSSPACEGRLAGAPGPDLLPSVGLELSVDLEAGYFIPLPLRAGVALPLRGPDPHRPQLYLRVGRAF